MKTELYSFPMEIHVMFCNTNYGSSNEALGADDGLLILVFVCEVKTKKKKPNKMILAKNSDLPVYFQLTDKENSVLNNLTSNLHKIREAGTSTNIISFALSSLFDSDIKNYLFYSSSSHKEDETNSILWIISPKFVPINASQVRITFTQ